MNIETIISIATAVSVAASAIAALTPTPEPGTKLAMVYKIIDYLAINLGKAKDKGKSKNEL
jgi:hypothetical protein